jgi:hypothetical protein
MIKVQGDPCPRFGDDKAVEKLPVGVDHLGSSNLARRVAPVVNKNPVAVNNNSVHASEPVNNKVHAEKLEVARAALGKHAVEPPPLVDETKTRGRPKVHEDRAGYRAEYMRNRRANERERRSAAPSDKAS